MESVIYHLKATNSAGEVAETIMESDNHYDVMFFFFEKYLSGESFVDDLVTFEMKKIGRDMLTDH